MVGEAGVSLIVGTCHGRRRLGTDQEEDRRYQEEARRGQKDAAVVKEYSRLEELCMCKKSASCKVWTRGCFLFVLTTMFINGNRPEVVHDR